MPSLVSSENLVSTKYNGDSALRGGVRATGLLAIGIAMSLTTSQQPSNKSLPTTQVCQHIVRCIHLADPRKDFLSAITVCLRVSVGDRICDKHQVVAEIIGAARRCFNAITSRNPRQEDLSDATLTQRFIE